MRGLVWPASPPEQCNPGHRAPSPPLSPGALPSPLPQHPPCTYPACPPRCVQGGLPVGAGGALELAAADMTQRATLLPEMFAGVTQLVVCTAVKVGGGRGRGGGRGGSHPGGGVLVGGGSWGGRSQRVGEAGAREWCFAVSLLLTALLGWAGFGLAAAARGRGRGLQLGGSFDRRLLLGARQWVLSCAA